MIVHWKFGAGLQSKLRATEHSYS